MTSRHSTTDLAGLFARCQSGDEAAWTDLVDRYERLVYSTALQAGLDSDSAADVFQQTWTELHRSLLRIRDPQALPRWLIVTTQRLAYKHAVVNRRWVDVVRDDLADPAPSPESDVVALEQRDALEQAMSRLDDRCRDALLMMYFGETRASYRDVARHFGIAEDSVGSLKTRCLKKLRSLMGEDS